VVRASCLLNQTGALVPCDAYIDGANWCCPADTTATWCSNILTAAAALSRKDDHNHATLGMPKEMVKQKRIGQFRILPAHGVHTTVPILLRQYNWCSCCAKPELRDTVFAVLCGTSARVACCGGTCSCGCCAKCCC
jgi:hypothetical protein